MSEIKPCKVCNFTRQKYYGVVVVSLSQLKAKGKSKSRIHYEVLFVFYYRPTLLNLHNINAKLYNMMTFPSFKYHKVITAQ